MSWIEDRLIRYLYRNEAGEEMVLEAPAKDEIPPPPEGYSYVGFLPEKTGIMTRVQYEQNGYKAYKIDVGDGKNIYRSAAREKYEHTMGNTASSKYKDIKSHDNVYSKSYQKHVNEKKKKTEAMHVHNLKKIFKGE